LVLAKQVVALRKRGFHIENEWQNRGISVAHVYTQATIEYKKSQMGVEIPFGLKLSVRS